MPAARGAANQSATAATARPSVIDLGIRVSRANQATRPHARLVPVMTSKEAFKPIPGSSAKPTSNEPTMPPKVLTAVMRPTLRADRDGSRYEKVLSALGRAAETDENLMPYILEAVKVPATLGETCDVLREVFGEYDEPPIY